MFLGLQAHGGRHLLGPAVPGALGHALQKGSGVAGAEHDEVVRAARAPVLEGGGTRRLSPELPAGRPSCSGVSASTNRSSRRLERGFE